MTVQHEKVLIVGPAWVGDMVMAQSLFKLLKDQREDCHITVLAPDWTKPLLNCMPEVDAVVSSPFAHGELAFMARRSLAKRLREQAFAQAIVLPGSLKSALVPFLAGIPVRTGYRGEMRYGLINDLRHLDKQRLPMNVQRFVALGLSAKAQPPSDFPVPALQVTANKVRESLRQLGIMTPEVPVLALCPGAEYGMAKRWPPEYFAELANKVSAQNWQVWLLGSENDQQTTREINALCDDACLDLAGATRLDQAIDLLSLTSAAVSNDSGLMHIAAALDLPLVGLFGSSSPGFTPPLGDRSTALWLGVECSPCFKRECPLGHFKCMMDLKPDKVFDTLVQVVDG